MSRAENEINVDGDRGVVLKFFNGIYTVVGCHNGWENYCRRQVSKDVFEDQAKPQSVILGNRLRAEMVLLQLLSAVRQYHEK